MLIDWFTVGAQALNFIVLVWLMKRFLYRPVLDAIAAREQRIAQQLAEAATQMAEAHEGRVERGRQRAGRQLGAGVHGGPFTASPPARPRRAAGRPGGRPRSRPA